ncbi:MAG: bifunctional diguanylate cyclase/phosphodiesterase [Coriobacteriia bacterium]|nr:bifunctional diguanylate cyclase/phosphodiesterase [Coriobacteriia bacterium]
MLSILQHFWIQILLNVAIISAIIIAVLYNSRKRNLREVEYIAYVDPITGLSNRLKFIENIAAIMEYEKSGRYALAVLDIDGYKSINDMYGMVFGDELLGFLGDRIRESAPEKALVARDTGDEFLLFTRYKDSEDLNDIFARIIASVSRVSFKHAGVLELSISTGVYLFSDEDCTPLSAINRADIARTRIKANHEKHINFFTEKMRVELANETILENDLKLALERGEFELYYQPKIRLDNNRINGFEGLIRWHHPLAGLLGPATFIPFAERIGLISKITEWVIVQCCKDVSQIGEWWAQSSSDFEQEHGAAPKNFAVRTSLNLSPVDLSNPHLIDILNEALTRYGVDPSFLEVEITESALIEDADVSMTTIRSMRDIGIDIALDDFGTGYSSLGYLKDLPLDTVKLDRIFIHDIETDMRSRKALRSIIDLVHTLDYKIVAEGIENEFQATFLKEAGCETGQGFYFAPAMPLSDSYQYFISALKEFGYDDAGR